MDFMGSDGKVINKEAPAGFSLYEMSLTSLLKKLSNKKDAARQNSRSFEITGILDLLEVINKSAGRCAYSGKLFKNNDDVTFERVDPNKGYTRENTVFVRTSANALKAYLDAFEKGDSIPEEMKIKILNKTLYRIQKRLKDKAKAGGV